MGTKSASPLTSIHETEPARFFDWLQCPKCSSSLAVTDANHALFCNQCNISYPLISDSEINIPLLFDHVDAAVQGWAARLNGFNQKINEEQEALRHSLKDKRMASATRQRVKSILRAKKAFQEQINIQLRFFNGYDFDPGLNANSALAQNQGVDSYINNIFRDWSWENGENEELIKTLQQVCPNHEFTAGKVLTLGAGAGRCSYDFHQKYQAEYSLLLDINPLLLTVANKIIDGNTVPLYEFPIAPISSESYAALHQCERPSVDGNALPRDFDYLLADVSNIPLKANTFDTVLTPWLIDIIPMDLREFIPHVNRLLKTGGTWLNTGTLAFFHKNEAWNYSEEEVIDLLKKYGFEVIGTARTRINYMQSPYSAHGRVEQVFSFCAKKKFDSIPAKPHKYLPDWITNSTLPVPQLDELVAVSSKFLLQAQVLSAVDGARSITDIGKLLAKQYSMSEKNACAAVRKILSDNYKEYIS